MGYQESWVYIEPQWNFKKLLHAYERAKADGYYELFGVEPLSVIILKRPIGKIPAGKKLLWVCGDRGFHCASGLFGFDLKFFGKLQIIPVEDVLYTDEPIIENICFNSPNPSENRYMKRYSITDYINRINQEKIKDNTAYPER